ncbi:uncharacterized protein si:ch211-12e13.1 isoform X2 [Kryptolebias marmoratus]|uniref:uncharacterized protein si:ch211-12e13.1 isoform X2 n=1 Tax=Kryptolebias marmoratus TaxID=37003 RepID=UPI0007F8D788|nr:uncharacterized protein si:ch211-12e13.1 isoform X2 [Kryptolebias marmoratus]
MGNAQSSVVAALSLCSFYLVYSYIYRSHQLLKTNVLSSDRLPSLAYLSVRYLSRAVTRRAGHLYTPAAEKPVVYTALNCRLDGPVLRRFCSSAGYGWDYPDCEHRDVPLCFPESLCCRLMLVLLTDGNFQISPAGLVRVRQTLRTLQPIDELKKGPFTLQVRVQGYEQTDAGVEVDICLAAVSRSGCPVWESILTLLSTNRRHKASTCLLKNGDQAEQRDGRSDELAPENMKQVELKVSRTSGLQCVWPLTDYSPHQILAQLPRFFGFRSQTAPGLWILSVCLAEIEKHKGVGVITAPVSITAQFKEPLLLPGKVLITFWEVIKNMDQASPKELRFHVQQPGHNFPHMLGRISRS